MTREEKLATAFRIATSSPDTSTQNGAVLFWEAGLGDMVIGAAPNRFPTGVTPRLVRPEKYSFIEHAERGAIYEAARRGEKTHGSVMYAAWAACADCARAIVISGVHLLVRCAVPTDDPASERWRESVQIGDRILLEGGVTISELPMLGADVPSILRDGVGWRP